MPQNSTTRRGRAIDGRTRDILTGVQIDGTHVRRTYTSAENPVRVAAPRLTAEAVTGAA